MDEQLRAVLPPDFICAVDELLALDSALGDDIRKLYLEAQAEPSNQTARRAFVRACWAYVEAVVFSIKRYTHVACHLGGVELRSQDISFLSETQLILEADGSVKEKQVLIRTLENVKQTFRLSSRIFDLDWTPGFGTTGWKNFRGALELRHRLTHPKTIGEIEVDDDAFKLQESAAVWFAELFHAYKNNILKKYSNFKQ